MHPAYNLIPRQGREMTASERREHAWSLIKTGNGSQDDQSKASGLTVSRIADYRRLWKYISATHPEDADRFTCGEAMRIAKANGVRTHR